ncbi:nicotinamide mononucleotide adenylyl transferase [Ascosphaera apis ARSEF 7405]|uniref:Nicotinamide-nucleotide adenylyltransferase n=1 Tax=Ascosphaera apis ARSEF 7405 TaxID=392613 RepID=A0A167VCD1_9EURO|nr:nicotinamide mononucleotide adenylyl transferase [Ascosphaera apis ARSEF 7405]
MDKEYHPPPTIPIAQLLDPSRYVFPRSRLRRCMRNPSKTPLLLVACGSFSPITYLHLRMFEMAADYVKFNTKFELMGGYLSPVSDAYKKIGLASARHRVAMCELAVQQTSTWLMVDSWEPMQKEYVPTANVLDHFDTEINIRGGGVETGEKDPKTGEPIKKQVRIALLAGADLIHTMSTPGVWSPKDLQHILGRYGTFIVERTGTDIDEAIASLQQYKANIYVIHQMIQNDVSSTKIRMFLRREMSVRYLIPGSVIDYIERHKLYEEDSSLGQGGNRRDKKEEDDNEGDNEDQNGKDGNDDNDDENTNFSKRESESAQLRRVTAEEESEGLTQGDDTSGELKLTRAESNFNALPNTESSQSKDGNEEPEFRGIVGSPLMSPETAERNKREKCGNGDKREKGKGKEKVVNGNGNGSGKRREEEIKG